jgi:hypothetical protein
VSPKQMTLAFKLIKKDEKQLFQLIASGAESNLLFIFEVFKVFKPSGGENGFQRKSEKCNQQVETHKSILGAIKNSRRRPKTSSDALAIW